MFRAPCWYEFTASPAAIRGEGQLAAPGGLQAELGSQAGKPTV